MFQKWRFLCPLWIALWVWCNSRIYVRHGGGQSGETCAQKTSTTEPYCIVGVVQEVYRVQVFSIFNSRITCSNWEIVLNYKTYVCFKATRLGGATLTLSNEVILEILTKFHTKCHTTWYGSIHQKCTSLSSFHLVPFSSSHYFPLLLVYSFVNNPLSSHRRSSLPP